MSRRTMDLMDALDLLDDAEDIINSFHDTITNSLEGDHPDYLKIEEWLNRYEHG